MFEQACEPADADAAEAARCPREEADCWRFAGVAAADVATEPFVRASVKWEDMGKEVLSDGGDGAACGGTATTFGFAFLASECRSPCEGWVWEFCLSADCKREELAAKVPDNFVGGEEEATPTRIGGTADDKEGPPRRRALC